MERPQQSPPIVRRYMREIVGRKGKVVPPPHSVSPNAAPPSKTRPRGPKKGQPAQEQPRPDASANFVVELTVCHFRPNWRRRR